MLYSDLTPNDANEKQSWCYKFPGMNILSWIQRDVEIRISNSSEKTCMDSFFSGSYLNICQITVNKQLKTAYRVIYFVSETKD